MLNLDYHLRLDSDVPKSPNLAPLFGAEDLERIGALVWEGYEADERSREAWVRRNQAAMDLALQLQKDKTFPWPGASNVAFPLVTIAAMQFHSRAYPALISGTDIVKFRCPATDKTSDLYRRASRVGKYMSYQVLEEDQSWEEQHDRLLLQIPIVGCAFIKTYRSPAKGHNVSELVPAMSLAMNYYAKSVEECGRKTHSIPYFRNQVYERCKAGTWIDITKDAWYTAPVTPFQAPGTHEADARKGLTAQPADDATALTFLEQHCYFDFDKDGYQEPYTVTIEATSHKVVRIVARWEEGADVERNGRGEMIRIRATESFTKYGLIPSPDGSVYDLGFGLLLGPLNESVNTLLNQIIDSGTMSNTAGGFFGRGVKIRGGAYTFQPFGWQRVDSTGDDIRKSIFELPVREPSAVLFNVLTFLVNYTQRIGGATDMIQGENPGQNTPAQTSQAMIEQGMKIYSALFKRVWRCMKEEFSKLYILNTRHMPASKPFGDGRISREDFMGDASQICPTADPNVTSDLMRLQQASAIADRAHQVPGYDVDEAEIRLLAAMKVDGIETLYTGVKNLPPPGPTEKVQVATIKEQTAQLKIQAEMQRFVVTMMEETRVNDATITNLQAQAAEHAANADSETQAHETAQVDAMIGLLKLRNDHLRGAVDMELGKLKLATEAFKAHGAASKADAAAAAAVKKKAEANAA